MYSWYPLELLCYSFTWRRPVTPAAPPLKVDFHISERKKRNDMNEATQKQANPDRLVCGHKSGGTHAPSPSCSLLFFKPSLTYPSIIEKLGDSIHHSFLLLWTLSPWFQKHAKDWKRATGLLYGKTSYLYVAIVILSSTAALLLYVRDLSSPLWTCHTESFLQIVLWRDGLKEKTIAADNWIWKDSHGQQDMFWNRLVRPFSKRRKSIRFLN